MIRKKINLETISSTWTVLIPRADNATKRQMLSLISLVISFMCMFTPFLQIVSAGVGVSISGPMSYTIDKTVTGVNGQLGGNVTKAGDVISYQINVTNDGSVNLTNVIVTDPLIYNLTGNNDTSLDAGETWTYTGNYTVTQTELNNNGTTRDGFIINNATVFIDRMDPKNAIVRTPIEQNANCTINKIVTFVAGNGSGGNVTKEGDIVSYQINITNSGNIELTNVTVTDPLINNLIGPISSIYNDTVLNVGGSWIYTGNYTVARADITNNNGNGLVNNAIVNSDQLGPKNDTVQIPMDTDCSIDEIVTDVAGQGPGGNVTAAGDIIGYQVNVTNKGILDLTNITVTASLIGNLTETIGDDVNSGVLNPGETWTYYGNFTVTQSDMNSDGTVGDGFIENTASINCDQLGPKNDTDQVPIERKVGYSIFKSVIGPDESGDYIVNSPGDKIPYRIVIKNEGNVDLTGISVKDSTISLMGPTGDDNNPGVLNPGEKWTYFGNYLLTSADINSRNDYINNTATVSCNELPTKSSSTIQPIAKKTDLSIYKSVTGIDDIGDYIINNPGDIISYQIAVKNNGDVDLHDVKVTDSLIDNLSESTGDSIDPGVLNAGETWVYTGNYSVTPEDINNNGMDGSGYIKNTATVSCDEHSSESSSIELPIIRVINFGTDSEIDNTSAKVFPAANFSASITSGYAPLSVQFTDHSQNAAAWNWDFNNDGVADSITENPVYIYTSPGTYVSKLTVSNANGTDTETATINVLQAASSNGGGSSEGSSHSSGGSSGTATVVSSSSNYVNGSTVNTSAASNVTQPENNNMGLEQSNRNKEANVEKTPEQKATSSPAKQSTKTPGFEIISGITALLALVLYRRKQK